MELFVRLIGEAWEHRRRRRRNALIALWLVTVAVIGWLLVGRPGKSPPGPEPHPIGSGYVVESPSRLFSQAPYMGVHCPVPNSIACDRVGLAINLRQQARAVVAFIDGRQLKMNRFGDLIDSSTAPRKEFDG